MKPFAVFVISQISPNSFAATTRPNGGIGLPGGKVDIGENPIDAVIREAKEEGWEVSLPIFKVHSQLFDGKMVFWYVATQPAKKLSVYKEMGRINPILATLDEIVNSGLGNDWLKYANH
jgi:hypothetical protein